MSSPTVAVSESASTWLLLRMNWFVPSVTSAPSVPEQQNLLVLSWTLPPDVPRLIGSGCSTWFALWASAKPTEKRTEQKKPRKAKRRARETIVASSFEGCRGKLNGRGESDSRLD